MKNHYIPQFLIKRFSETINVLNVHDADYKADKRPAKVFYDKDIYDDDVEQMLNTRFERRFANLLKDKILNQDTEITLSRVEANFVRLFMLVMSVRTLLGDGLRHFLNVLKSDSERYMKLYFGPHKEILEKLPSIDSLNISDKEILNNFLRAIGNINEFTELLRQKGITREMVVFAVPFLRGFLAFWDADKDTDFILTDNGVIYDVEGAQQLTNVTALSKHSYLKYMIEHSDNKLVYCDLFNVLQAFPENSLIFNLSKKRTLLLINPFFAMYGKNGYKTIIQGDKDEVYRSTVPDIWPATLQRKELYTPCEKNYLIRERFVPTIFDSFTYPIQTLTLEETIVVNFLLYNQARQLVGFDNLERIVDSLFFILEFNSSANACDKNFNISKEEFECNQTKSFFDNPLTMLLFKESQKSNGFKFRGRYTDLILNDYVNNLLKDFKTNFYIYEALAKDMDFVRNNDMFRFLDNSPEHDRYKHILNKREELRKNK